MHRPRVHLVVIATLALIAGLLVSASQSAAAAPAAESPTVTRADVAPRVAAARAKRFATTWGEKANRRNWAWIREHSKIAASRDYGSGIRISEVKWFLRAYGRLTFGSGRCSDRYDVDDDPTTTLCYANKGENLQVKRTRSGRLVATSFWVED